MKKIFPLLIGLLLIPTLAFGATQYHRWLLTGDDNVTDEVMRLDNTNDGTLWLGSGAGQDTNLYRSSANNLKTDDTFTALAFVGNITGNLTGNASTATLASTVTVVDSTDATSFIAMFDSATGSLAAKTDALLTYNATTGGLSAAGFYTSEGIMGSDVAEPGTDYITLIGDTDNGIRLYVDLTTKALEISPAGAFNFQTFALTSTGIGTFGGLVVDTPTLVVNASGYTDKVGIGVSDPDELLELYKVGTQLKLSGGAADYATFAVAADGALTITTVDTDAAEGDILLMPDGFLGVNNAAPTSQFHLIGAVNTDIFSLDIGITHQLNMGASNAAPYEWYIQSESNTDSTKYALTLNPEGGNVGVGEDTPLGGLHIANNSNQWSSSNYGTNLLIEGSAAPARNPAIGIFDSTHANPWAIANVAGNLYLSTMPVLGNTATASGNQFYFTSGADMFAFDGTVGMLLAPATAIGYLGCTSNHPLGLIANNTEYLRVNAAGGGWFTGGNIGLGGTSAATIVEIASGALTMVEMSAPGTPAATKVALYAIDDGDSTTSYYIKFDDGTAVRLAGN